MAAPGWEPQAFDVRGQLIPTKPGGMEQDISSVGAQRVH